MKEFKYQLKQQIKLVDSGQTGTVVARADYVNSADSYMIRMKNAQGDQVCDWWSEDAILAVEAI